MTVISLQSRRASRGVASPLAEEPEVRERVTKSVTRNVTLVATSLLKLSGRTAFITFLTNVIVTCSALLVKEGGHEARDAAIGIAIDHTD
ncbi:hypothetical protein PQJ75_00915 [Rhodoplanes sp. TEM]|uniref:Uncharacterized protein n=1 Tax=Rhodoplanes tepidamans TaxID=200616 RepID=A0ABT5J5B1_RHOTP|nr:MULTISPECIES: hypothetical protein [Rhodoplanes]MDC7784814.1 hypothetical protein [Rhodoplanes tepidamans]MDC7982281.1 hypothetical protein [Rhodoplanes sp. TEM]MDQ0356288.1 hypothetical protein [Rhodoplanes tepidamans]